MVIYLDILIALNMFIDYILLRATALLLHLPFRRWRMVIGALAGGLSSCMILLPAWPAVLSVLSKLVLAGILTAITFQWQGPRPYIKQLVVFFVTSTVFAGCSFALWFFAAPDGFTVIHGIVYYDVSPLLLVALTVVSYGLIRLYERFIRKKAPISREYILTFDMGAGKLALRALYDTGCSLTEPFSGRPVVVVEKDAVASFLPPRLQPLLSLEEGKADGLPATLFRMIPYRTVRGDGLLPAFEAKELLLTAPGGTQKRLDGVYVALCPTLHQSGVEALFGNDIGDLLAEAEESRLSGGPIL